MWEGLSVYGPRSAIEVLTGQCVHTGGSTAAVMLLAYALVAACHHSAQGQSEASFESTRSRLTFKTRYTLQESLYTSYWRAVNLR